MDTDSTNKFVWFAAYLKSRHEFRVRELVTNAGIESFLPTVDTLRRWKDRKKIVTFPLFPGYIFTHIDNNKAAMLSVLKTPGVVRFLSIEQGKPTPVSDVQINSLKTIVENKIPVEPYPYLKKGQRVRIKSGLLAGVEGILLERKAHHILVLSVDILKQGASVKIDAVDVEPV